MRRPGCCPPLLRNPTSLTLNQSEPLTEPFGLSTVLDVSATTPSLAIGQGALIQGDPGASTVLNSNVRILEEGTLLAPAGTIA